MPTPLELARQIVENIEETETAIANKNGNTSYQQLLLQGAVEDVILLLEKIDPEGAEKLENE